ncbi:MAG: glycolate oxidase subunit GlcE [Pseudomonadota bacterium]|jgi:glycolate oxidase FAD binding subunit
MTTIEQLQDRIQSAAASRTLLRIRGGGSKDFYGESLQGEVLDVSSYSGVIEYEPTELVITARCGTPLAELEAALDAQNQMLAFEPPHFSSLSRMRERAQGEGIATIGGVIASGIGGPTAVYAGRVRDFVLGAKLIDGKGQHLAFGGQVMKNVAGYDVSRLLAGSLGTLGVITQVSLKVLPKPVASSTLQLELGEADAIRKLNEWAGQPLPLSASAWRGGVLCVRLAGAHAAVSAAVLKMGGSIMQDAHAVSFWRGVREHTDAFFKQPRGGHPVIRVTVPSTTPPLGLPGDTLMEWGGAQRWVMGCDLQQARDAAKNAGGHATRFSQGDTAANGGFMSPLDPVTKRIHLNLKNEFDPAAIFNRGRMFADL